MISSTQNKQGIMSEHKTGLTPGRQTNMGLIQLIGPYLTLTGVTIGKRELHWFYCFRIYSRTVHIHLGHLVSLASSSAPPHMLLGQSAL